MILEDVDPLTLWFSDRPNRLAFTTSTAAFVHLFRRVFASSTPNAVVAWEQDSLEKFHVVELLGGVLPFIPGSSATAPLRYETCGLALGSPAPPYPVLPDQQSLAARPQADGRIQLFIDPTSTQQALGVPRRDPLLPPPRPSTPVTRIWIRS